MKLYIPLTLTDTEDCINVTMYSTQHDIHSYVKVDKPIS